jgi:hypothetical protein
MNDEIMGNEYIPDADELASNAAIAAQAEANKQRELEQVALKESALAKLAKLGLTEAEARAVIGL